MAGKRKKPEDIVAKLRQIEVLQGQGMTTAEAVRHVGTTQQPIQLRLIQSLHAHGRHVIS